MKSFILSFLSYGKFSAKRKTILTNFFGLSSVEAANYILPLITLPYLVRVLGIEKYGLIVFAQALMQYFIFFTDYGFNLSATRSISIDRDNNIKVSRIFNSVMSIKVMFTLISLLFLISVVYLVPKFRRDSAVYLFSFGMVIGSALFPVWFFQGKEEMRFIALLNLITKSIFTAAIFIFIKSETDYIRVPVINSFGYLTAGMLGLSIAYGKFRITFTRPSFSGIIHELKEGWYVFISTMSISLYLTTNTFLLGLFANNAVVGYFVAGEKLVRAVTRLFNPLLNTVYPHISEVAAKSKEMAVKKLKKLVAAVAAASLFTLALLYIFGDSIIGLLFGRGFSESVAVVRILAPLVVIIPLAGIFANIALLAFRLDKYFFRIYANGGIINIALLIVFVYVLRLGARGAAMASLLTETALTLAMYAVLRRNGIRIL